MRRPPLTKKRLRGLETLANHFEAGSPQDLFGFEKERLDDEGLTQLSEVKAACEWLRDMRVYQTKEGAERGVYLTPREAFAVGLLVEPCVKEDNPAEIFGPRNAAALKRANKKLNSD